MSKRPLILVDGSNLWYRAYTATMLEPPGGPVMICSSMLRKICEDRGKNNVILCWDAGDGGRKSLDPEYKAGRKPVEGVWENLKHMKRMVKCLGITTAETQGFEADDTIGSLAAQSDKEVLISSYDKDFYQLINEKVKVIRPAKTIRGQFYPELIVDEQGTVDEFGCKPEGVVLFKSLKGDPSDNIPKVGIRFTKKFKEPFFEALASSKTVAEFYEKIDLFDDKYKEELLSFQERAELSFKIATINVFLTPSVTECDLSEGGVRALCEELEIRSVKLDDWVLLSDPDYQEEQEMPKPKQGSLFS